MSCYERQVHVDRPFVIIHPHLHVICKAYGVPTPPKINFGSRHSNLIFNIRLTNSTSNLSCQHPTLALNIQSLNELPVSINDVELAMICIFRLQVWTFQRHAKTRPRTVFEFEHVSILKIDTGEMYIAHTALSVEPAIIKPLRNADFVLKCWLRFETFTSFWDVYFVLRCWLRFKMLTSFWDVDFVLRCWADKDTTTVIMHKQEKAKEGQVLLDDRNNYTPLEEPMVEETFQKVKQITEELYQGGYIDEMTVKWLSQTPNPPKVPVFYTLTKIHKPTSVGRPIISGNDGPTERISVFVDNILQPIAQSQKSYLKDTTDFINFI